MANVLINEDTMTDIADAIRSKKGVSTTYKPSDMPTAIESISGGGITPTGTKNISVTQNGTTTEDVTNYASAQITVNVPTGGGLPLSLKRAFTETMDATYTSANKKTITFDPITDTFTHWAVLVWMPKPTSDGTNPIEWVNLKTDTDQNYGAMVRANGTDGTDSNATTVTTESLQGGSLQVGGQYGYFVSGFTYQFYIFTD